MLLITLKYHLFHNILDHKTPLFKHNVDNLVAADSCFKDETFPIQEKIEQTHYGFFILLVSNQSYRWLEFNEFNLFNYYKTLITLINRAFSQSFLSVVWLMVIKPHNRFNGGKIGKIEKIKINLTETSFISHSHSYHGHPE